MMAKRSRGALLFDFFGTLVEYQPDRSRLGYPGTHELAMSLGFRTDHDSFAQTWDSASHALERAARTTMREFSMSEAAAAFAAAAGLTPTSEEVDRLGLCYMVPNILDQMSIKAEVSTVVLSVEQGWIKPHESIYRAALERVGCRPDEAVFIGDSFEADYVGPTEAGMRAFLIDPDQEHPVPEHHRLSTVREVETVLDGEPHRTELAGHCRATEPRPA